MGTFRTRARTTAARTHPSSPLQKWRALRTDATKIKPAGKNGVDHEQAHARHHAHRARRAVLLQEVLRPREEVQAQAAAAAQAQAAPAAHAREVLPPQEVLWRPQVVLWRPQVLLPFVLVLLLARQVSERVNERERGGASERMSERVGCATGGSPFFGSCEGGPDA